MERQKDRFFVRDLEILILDEADVLLVSENISFESRILDML